MLDYFYPVIDLRFSILFSGIIINYQDNVEAYDDDNHMADHEDNHNDVVFGEDSVSLPYAAVTVNDGESESFPKFGNTEGRGKHLSAFCDPNNTCNIDIGKEILNYSAFIKI